MIAPGPKILSVNRMRLSSMSEKIATEWPDRPACRLAIEDDDWSEQKEDYDCSGHIYVTGVWPGEGAAYGAAALAISITVRRGRTAKGRSFQNPARGSQVSRAGAGGQTVGLPALAAACRRCDR